MKRMDTLSTGMPFITQGFIISGLTYLFRANFERENKTCYELFFSVKRDIVPVGKL